MILHPAHDEGRRQVLIVLWDVTLVGLWVAVITATGLWAIVLGPFSRKWRTGGRR